MNQILHGIEYIKSKEIVDIIIACGVLILFIILSSVFARIIMKCFKIKSNKLTKKTKLYRISKFIWIITGTYISLRIFGLPDRFMAGITKVFKLALIYGITRFCANLVGRDTKLYSKIRDSDKNSADEHTLSLGVKLIRGVIYIIGAFVFVAELGYDLSGLITGLGIGSVVVALAAQDLAKNLFGGFAILSDKTFIIGDTIESGDIYGTVEDISFRTTKIRKLDDTVVTVPNAKLADANVVNWNKLKKRRYDCDLKLGLQTSQRQINDIIEKLYKELGKNKNIIENSIRIYFSDIERDGYNIKLYLYTNIVDYDKYLEFINNLNSEILEVLDKENVNLVYPTISVKN